MRHLISGLVGGLILLSGVCHAAEPITMAAVIAKHSEARGIQKTPLDGLYLESSGEWSSPGSNLKIAVYTFTGSGKYRSEATLQGLTQVTSFDGQKGFKVDPFEGRKDPESISEDELKTLRVDADLEWPFVHAEQKGHTLEWLGKDEIDGGDAYGIRVHLKDGNERTYWLDADSFMVIREVAKSQLHGVEYESETDYSDYELVDGVYVPMALSQGAKNSPAAQKSTVHIHKAIFKHKLDDAIFSSVTARGTPQ